MGVFILPQLNNYNICIENVPPSSIWHTIASTLQFTIPCTKITLHPGTLHILSIALKYTVCT